MPIQCRLRLLPLLLVCLLIFAAHAEAPAPWYGVYPESRWMRTDANITANAIVQLPAWTLIRFTGEKGDFYAVEAMGKTGFVHRLGAEAIPYTAPEESTAQEGSLTQPVAALSAPLQQAPAAMQLDAGLRLKIYPVSQDYALVRYKGQEGYAPLACWQQKTYVEQATAPDIRRVRAATQVYASPLDGADPAWMLPADTPVVTEAVNGDAVRIRLNEQVGYVPGQVLCELPADEAIPPLVARLKRGAAYRTYPLSGSPDAGTLDKALPVIVTALNGSFVRVSHGAEACYLPMDALTREGRLDALLTDRAQKQSEQRILSAALSMVEQSNPFLLRYQAQGGDTQARFTYGAPYYFGGTNGNLLLKPWVMHTNSLYYVKGRRYLYGFDCIGFARWVCKTAGLNRPVRISSMPWETAHLVDVKDLPLEQWHERLEIGDLVALGKTGSYHVGMYIGTLRSFGYTEKELAQLAPYMDYPLMIHSGMNDFHTAWYESYMLENNISGVGLPDGGVMISLLTDAYADAEASVTLWQGTPNQKTFHYNMLEGYHLTRMNLLEPNVRWFVVYRPGRK